MLWSKTLHELLSTPVSSAYERVDFPNSLRGSASTLPSPIPSLPVGRIRQGTRRNRPSGLDFLPSLFYFIPLSLRSTST